MVETNSPLVSVILPFFNAALTLNRAIKSIANQTYVNLECILVNNNSTDNSVAIANKWSVADKRFILISETKQGVVYAFNKAARIAKGKYIARMDADDFSYRNRLKWQVSLLESKKHIGVVSGLVKYISHNKNTEGFVHYVQWVNSVKSHEQIYLSQFIESPVVNPTAMWRREVGEKNSIYKAGDFPEDYEMYLRWLQNGVQMEKVDKFVLKWHDSNTRLTRTASEYSDEAFYKIKSEYLFNWLKLKNPYHPKVVVWGASKLSRKHASYIVNQGVKIDYFVDVNKNRQVNKPVIYYENLPSKANIFILVYLKHNDLRQKIREFLNGLGYKEGERCIFVS